VLSASSGTVNALSANLCPKFPNGIFKVVFDPGATIMHSGCSDQTGKVANSKVNKCDVRGLDEHPWVPPHRLRLVSSHGQTTDSLFNGVR
jgi:hypothetical protein